MSRSGGLYSRFRVRKRSREKQRERKRTETRELEVRLPPVRHRLGAINPRVILILVCAAIVAVAFGLWRGRCRRRGRGKRARPIPERHCHRARAQLRSLYPRKATVAVAHQPSVPRTRKGGWKSSPERSPHPCPGVECLPPRIGRGHL